MIDPQAVQPYCREDFLTLTLEDNYFTLAFSLSDEQPDYEWLEGEGILGKLAPIREQIMQGDYRALYLSWLKAVSSEDPEQAIGRMKMRARTMRSYKTWPGMQTALRLAGTCLDQDQLHPGAILAFFLFP